MNRSATVTVAYLLKHEKFSLREALKFVFEKRPVTRPRDKYIKQLMELEKVWFPNKSSKECELN